MASGFNVFYKNVWKHITTTGSIAPSSRYLARAISRCVETKDEPLSILEVGPGTGPFTRVLVQKMKEDDHLDLCELNDEFVSYLSACLESDPILSSHKDQISIHHQSILDFKNTDQYDYIISGLPFNNFPPQLVSGILEHYTKILKPGGKLSFFEYAFIRPFKAPFLMGNERIRVHEIDRLLRNYLSQYELETIFVLMNVPPSLVHVCQFSNLTSS